MTELALRVLYMGLMAAVVAGIVLPLRWGAKRLRLPAGLCVVLWLVVLVRMALPVGLATSTLSLLRWSAPAVERQVASVSQAVAGPAAEVALPPVQTDGPGPDLVPAIAPAEERAPVQAPPAEPVRWQEALPWLWLAGVLVLWGYTAVSWVLLRLRLRTAVRRESLGGTHYWESGWVSSPFVFGLLRPRVYVPLGLEGDTLDWVLRHEYAHLRLKHHWIKVLFFLALGLHWYNPVLWLGWVLFCRDLEVHCDEVVLRAAPGGQKAYSSALLALAAPGRGPLLPPGFGETGVKERIRRALAYRRPGRAVVVVAVLLGVLLAVGLGCDPVYAPLPDETPDLKVQSDFAVRYPMEAVPPEVQARLASEYGMDLDVQMLDGAALHWSKISPMDLSTSPLPVPGWTEDGYPIGFTLFQPEATLELYLEGEAAPDLVTCTEYLYDEETDRWTAPRQLEGPSGLNGVDGQYWMRLDRRADAAGTGMEHRLLRVACTWDNGKDTRTLEYPVLLQMPSVAADDPLLEPILMVDGSRIQPEDTAYVDYGKYVHITDPRGRSGTYTLERSQSETGPRTFVSGSTITAESQGGFGFRLFPMGEGAERYRDELQYYTLTYTWEDGTEDVYTFALYALLPRPEVDAGGRRIKPALSDEWQDLTALLPAPAEWADQEPPGRNEAVTLAGVPADLLVAFPTAQTGWAVACIGRGAADGDTYVYYSNDGGNSWTEVGRPQRENGALRRPCVFYAEPWDDSKALLAFGMSEDAPVFRTTDCGQTWEELALPLPEDAKECVEIVSDTTIVFSSKSDPETRYTFYALNAEQDRWELVSHLEDPERIPLWELPPIRWHSYGSDEEYVDTFAYMNAPIQPFGAVKGTEIALYAIYALTSEDEREPALLLRSGDHLDVLPVSGWEAPWRGNAQLTLKDYDGDGTEELSLLLYEGHGTGISVWGLYMLEPDGAGWRLAASMPGLDLVDTLDLTQYDVPEQTVVGMQVHFTPEGDRFTLSVGLCSTEAPYTLQYTGDLVGQVSYNGTDLVIGDMDYTPGYIG